MSSSELASKVISRARPRKTVWPVASFKLPPDALTAIDAVAGLLSKQTGAEVTRSDVLYTGTMRFVKEVLGSWNAD